jgi:hypothetical protein
LVEDQVAIEMLPTVILAGLAENATVGATGVLPPPVEGYALFDPGKTGTPPGTSTSTMLTLEVAMVWFAPICTRFVPAIRSLAGIVTEKVRHVKPEVSGYGHGT